MFNFYRVFGRPGSTRMHAARWSVSRNCRDPLMTNRPRTHSTSTFASTIPAQTLFLGIPARYTARVLLVSPLGVSRGHRAQARVPRNSLRFRRSMTDSSLQILTQGTPTAGQKGTTRAMYLDKILNDHFRSGVHGCACRSLHTQHGGL